MGFTVPSNRSVSTQVFEIGKSHGIELEKIIREELSHSNYTYYLPIISGEGYRRVAGYVEQVAAGKGVCSSTYPPPVSTTTVFYVPSWSCTVLKPPSIGAVHVVETCYDRGVNITFSPGNLTGIDRAVDLVANATRYSVSDTVLLTLVKGLDIPLVSEAYIGYRVVLSPRDVHIVRGLAFLTAFVSGLLLHYRFRPEEYAGFVRFFRRIRQRIGI